jgi:metal-dependent amidase/aminoacylase/carboxypeptidase family protein
MVHTMTGEPYSLFVKIGSNGCVSKNIVYKGVASHAGGSPNKGVNALYAANMGFNAVNALRETMVDGDYVRIHSIITNGGQMVNAIPSEIAVETQVRGKTNAIIKMANDKVNRAYAAAAASIGAKVEIHDRPGYSPVDNDATMMEIFERVAKQCTDPEKVKVSYVRGGGCSDIGDIQQVMPAIHPNVSGATGTSHGSDYYITDPESACLFSAKFQLSYLHELLKDDAAEAKRVIANYVPVYKTKAEYFDAINCFLKDKECVAYEDDGTVLLDF